MTRVRTNVWRGVALCAALTVVVALSAPAAGSAPAYPAVHQSGVSAREIKVGGIVTQSNDPTGASLDTTFDGVQAYFDYVNHNGGVYGRKLVLSSKRDDALANNRSEVQALLSEDHVFAALPIAVDLFTGATLLAKSGIPTFGWLINPEWGSEKVDPGPASFFGEAGSFVCFSCATASPTAWLPEKLHRQRVGVVAYDVDQSAGCAEGAKKSFERYHTAKLVFLDKSLTFGSPDFSAQVARMKKAKANLVITCLDGNGTVNLGREIKKQGLDAVQVSANLYNHDLVKHNAAVLDGSYLYTVFTPFEVKPQPPGTKRYFTWIKKAGGATTENSLVGWLNADLFVTGLRAAGPTFTRAKVVSAINALTSYDADGLVPPVDWRIADRKEPSCFAVSKIVKGAFTPVYGKPGRPFVCFSDDAKRLPENPVLSG